MSRKKTASEHLRNGDPQRRGVHKLDAALAREPRVESGLPESSPRLKGDAAAAYQFYALQLAQSRLDAKPDVYALERACVALAMCWRADKALAREGPVHRVPLMGGRAGARKRIGWRQVKSKWLAVRAEAEKSFRLFANQFGLCGPGSRASLEIDNSLAESEKHLWETLNKPWVPRNPWVPRKDGETPVTPEEPTR